MTARPTMHSLTHKDRQAAFERLRLHGSQHPDLATAMADPLAKAAINFMALQKRLEAWAASQTRRVAPVPRIVCGVDGHPLS